MNTLQQQFPAPKFRPAPDLQTNVVYKIPCADCSWCYIGETGRAFNTRRKEHLRNVITAAKGSRIANHAWSHDHSIDFNNASVIDKGSFRTRKNTRIVAFHGDSKCRQNGFSYNFHPNTIHNGFLTYFLSNTLHYGFMPNFHFNSIPNGFWPNFNSNTIHNLFLSHFNANTTHNRFLANFHPNTIHN